LYRQAAAASLYRDLWQSLAVLTTVSMGRGVSRVAAEMAG
jgi:hypothetical protein